MFYVALASSKTLLWTGARGQILATLKLLDLVDFFNLCPVNLSGSCSGPLESYISHCDRYHSTIDYTVLPNCLLDYIVSVKTYYPRVDNTADHLPIEICLSYSDKSVYNSPDDNIDFSGSKRKVRWYNFLPDEINGKMFHPTFTGFGIIFRRVLYHRKYRNRML